jgi:hypothetical protein
MNIDLTLIPSTLDAVHAGLLATVAGLLILQILFLTAAFTALYGKRKTAQEAIPQPVEKPAAPPPLPAAPKVTTPETKPEPARVKPETVIIKEYTPDAALQLLGLLQKEARFIDFAQEDVSQYSDADIGAAARVVHEGCRKVLRQHFELDSVRSEPEGKRITLPKGFDAGSIRITGNIIGTAPFTGTLVHRGWKATEVKLPKVTEGHDVKIVAPAEVEL